MEVGDLIRLTGTNKLGIVMNVDKYKEYRQSGAGSAAIGGAPDDRVVTVTWLHTEKIGRAWFNSLELVNGSR